MRRPLASSVPALALALASAVTIAGVALAQGAVEGDRPACVQVTATPRAQAYGYDHVVVVRNGCEAQVTCRVSSDVNPAVTTLAIPPGGSRDTLLWRGSPASAFVATVTCEMR